MPHCGHATDTICKQQWYTEARQLAPSASSHAVMAPCHWHHLQPVMLCQGHVAGTIHEWAYHSGAMLLASSTSNHAVLGPCQWHYPKQQRQYYQQLPLQGPSPMVPMIARVWGGAGADAEWTDVPVTPLTTCRDLVDCCRDPGDEPCTLVEVSMGHERALSDSERPLEVLQQWRGRGPVRLVLRYTLDHDHDREHDLDLDNQRRLSPHTPLPSQVFLNY
ncbi:uncharacterized protein LOC124716675 [Schistocerca piceifrons]|uniref:uncharacterized protein LOC124716675 n=1 Tax=Schistocerca piceifrons TaxID=274613 RepID=UPI001F5EB348|nr:uncharacterized protein LOC124716675 [Schistocerca piceifrons]